jgi:hypothetical protein
MGKTRWMTGSLVGLALLVGSIAPAQARPRYDRGHDRGWGHHHRDRGNGFGFGDAVGVAALIGAVAIVASSMSKDKKVARNSDDAAPPPANGTDYGADVRRDDDFSDVAATHGQSDEMTDACAVAARDEAQGENGGYAEVRRMDEPRAAQDGYNIDGEVESRTSYRVPTGTTRRFTCTIKNGRVAQVYLSRDVVMR